MDPELVAYLDRRFAEMDRRFEQLRAEMRTGDAETRRHFDVGAEDLKSRIQLVAEGVLSVDEKLERFRAEVHERFEAVDRRFLRLETRVGALDVTVAQALRHRQN